jgi:tRNA pseudouridine38-40 synthase
MLKNIFLELEYRGTAYYGFQLQDKKNSPQITVQQVLEEALRKLYCEKIRIQYSSRTDKGVHAHGQCVNFKTAKNIPCENIKRALNTFLSQDVRVKRVKYVSREFHSRFSAKSKLYRYIIRNHRDCSVFWNEYCWHIPYFLDIKKMNLAAKKITGNRDFAVFAKKADKYHSCVRHVKFIQIKQKGKFIHIDIEANGFLRNLARNIVTFLVRVGQGKIALTQIKNILAKKTSYSNIPAPAAGLYLVKVKY